MKKRLKFQPNAILIFINFLLYIGLGLPDAILGSGWPSLRQSFGLDIAAIGYFTLLSVSFSFVSSLFYPWLAKRFTTDQITTASMLCIVIGLITMLFDGSVWFLIISSIFMGLGQGNIDIAVNNYSAKRFSSSLISFLHGFYGIGITLSSMIVAFSLKTAYSWQGGTVVILGLTLVILGLFYSQRHYFHEKDTTEEDQHEEVSHRFDRLDAMMMLFYIIYAVEVVVGKFLASYLVEFFGMSASMAATMATVYWAGLMIGRFTTGLIAKWLSDQSVIRLHASISCIAILLLYINHSWMYGFASFMIGFGFSALYPLMMMMPYKLYKGSKATRAVSLNVAGFQLGAVILPTVFGIMYEFLGLSLFPMTIFLCMVSLLALAQIILKNL